jgi:hypothetical protein
MLFYTAYLMQKIVINIIIYSKFISKISKLFNGIMKSKT